MKAILKHLDCIQHEPIQNWVPESPEDVDYFLRLHIGPDKSDISERFYVHILTPAAASKLSTEQSCGKRLIIGNYSWANVIDQIRSIINGANGSDWQKIRDQLRQYIDWEHENLPSEYPRQSH